VCRDRPPLDRFVAEGGTGFRLRYDGGSEDCDKLKLLLELDEASFLDMTKASRMFAERYDWSHSTKRFLHIYEATLRARRPQ
jgi:hypothetical protein